MNLVLNNIFPFQLDEFQLEAIDHLNQGKSVVVCAPTGSGKTVIAEYAVELALQTNKRCFYTTPLKALSNQKFHDFKVKYGDDKVGLLTGDISINRDAPVVVMTTEVFRNMLYGTSLGDVNRNLHDVFSVVLDECHYMNDAERGTVWEESIIYAPENIQLIALSATIANAEELTTWINETHGPTDLVSSDFRPVPLRFYYFYKEELFPLYNPGGAVNSKLMSMFPKFKQHKKGGRFNRQRIIANEVPDPKDVLSELHAKQMLPVIYFLFSRRGCEAAMRRCEGINLLTDEEKQKIAQATNELFKDHELLKHHPHLPYLLQGVAVHHAGMLPSWKAVVEKLFQKGLLKAVFATETLAAGINMPARTTIISAISKRTDTGHRPLTASEFLQMSGRAGRRGMDPVGHVVVLNHPFERLENAAKLAKAPADPLSSRFTPSYGMILNLLQRHTPEEAKDLIERSFGQFLLNQAVDPLYSQQFDLEKKLQETKNPDKIRSLNSKLKEMNRIIERQTNYYWRAFVSLSNILRVLGYLNADTPSPLGQMAAAIRATNEIFVCEVVMSKVFNNLSHSECAAVLTALISEESRADTASPVKISPNVDFALGQIQKIGRRLFRMQRENGIDVPVEFSPTFSGLSQMWADGASWEELVRMVDVDEGDIVRILRRTVDLCRQIAKAPHVPEALANLCLELLPMISRDEVKEVSLGN